MAGHARLAASQTKRWAPCPGWAAYMEAHPGLRGVSGQAAQMGTAAHALNERCLYEGSEPEDYLGRLIEIVEDKDGNEGTSILKVGAKMPGNVTRVVFEVDEDMVEAVGCMTSYVRRRCVELGLVDEGFDDRERAREVCNLVARGTVRLETRVNPLPERDDTGGTGDVVIDAWPDVLEAIDYKNGSAVFVSVEGNMQLRSYGLGALHEGGADDYGTVRYTICQPRCFKAPVGGIMYEETTPEELFEWKTWLAGRVDEVDEARILTAAGATLEELYGNGLLSTGEDGSHCDYCELLADCPAALARAQETAAADFDDEPGDVEVPTGADHLATVIPWVPFLDRWCKAVMATGEALLLSGGTIEGRKLVHGQSYRRWITERVKTDGDGEPVLNGDDEPVMEQVTEEMLAKALTEEYGVSKLDLYSDPEPTFLTGPQAEKKVPRAQRGAFNDELLHKPEGKLTMVPEDDPKQAVTVDPASDFDGVED